MAQITSEVEIRIDSKQTRRLLHEVVSKITCRMKEEANFNKTCFWGNKILFSM